MRFDEYFVKQRKNHFKTLALFILLAKTKSWQRSFSSIFEKNRIFFFLKKVFYALSSADNEKDFRNVINKPHSYIYIIYIKLLMEANMRLCYHL